MMLDLRNGIRRLLGIRLDNEERSSGSYAVGQKPKTIIRRFIAVIIAIILALVLAASDSRQHNYSSVRQVPGLDVSFNGLTLVHMHSR